MLWVNRLPSWIPQVGLLAGVLGLGVLVQGRYGDTFGGHLGWALGWPGWLWGWLSWFWGWLHCLCWGVCVHGDWFLPVKSVVDKFLVFTHCLLGFWLVGIGFSVHLRFQCGWCGCSVVGMGSLGVTLGVFLAHCVLCCVGGFCPACWRGLMDDETSSHYIFLFMLLLIPFLVISLNIKANIYIIYTRL